MIFVQIVFDLYDSECAGESRTVVYVITEVYGSNEVTSRDEIIVPRLAPYKKSRVSNTQTSCCKYARIDLGENAILVL